VFKKITIILAIQEALIRSTAVPGQPGKKVRKILSQQKNLGTGVSICYPCYSGKHK
jgi:hypothetical protein